MLQFCLITMRIGKTKTAKPLACSKDGVNAGSREEACGCSQFLGFSSPISWPASQGDPWSRESMFSRPHGTQLSKIDDFFVVVVLICSVLLWKWQGGCGAFRMLQTRILYLGRKINLGTWVRGVWNYLPRSWPKSGWKVFALKHLGIASSMTLRITDQKYNSTHMHT